MVRRVRVFATHETLESLRVSKELSQHRLEVR